MSVWYCIPSKRPPEEAERVLKLWRERGYKIALWRDSLDAPVETTDHVMGLDTYPGYALTVNALVASVLVVHPDCDWIVTGGDDVLPDPNHSAEEIARECSREFGIRNSSYAVERLKFYQNPEVCARGSMRPHSAFGVMQPTGDRDWGDRRGPYCDFVAGSPWMGREWCLRANQGRGPLWPEYFHMCVDDELQAVAEKYGVFWQRQDLIHKHMNWGRPTDGRRLVNVEEMPDFLKKANSEEEYGKAKRLFAARKAAGFPGSEPL
jgi:hypothetical protein